MTNLTLDVNIIDFPSIPVAMLPHRCSPELLNYSVAKFIMWRKETGLSPVNQSQTFGVAWDDPATTAPEAFRFDICGSVSEPIPDNRYGVSNGELTGGRYAVARHVGELGRYFTHGMGASFATGCLQAARKCVKHRFCFTTPILPKG